MGRNGWWHGHPTSQTNDNSDVNKFYNPTIIIYSEEKSQNKCQLCVQFRFDLDFNDNQKWFAIDWLLMIMVPWLNDDDHEVDDDDYNLNSMYKMITRWFFNESKMFIFQL